MATPTAAPLSDPTASTAPPSAPAPADAQRLQDVMAELRQLGAVDAAAQDRLMEDLRQSDPSLWPLVMEQFRATLAYRRWAAECGGAAEYAQRLPPTDDQVTQASYASPVAVDWRQQLVGAVAALEADAPDAAPCAAEARPILAEALAKVSEAAPLAIRNLAFCTEVLSYGRAKQVDKCEFFQNQEVLLYAEAENFASEPTRTGYHTSLRSNCRILDARGAQVDKHDFAATDDYCQQPRRDFFIAYRIRLPKQMAPGAYTLRLSIEDLKCHKKGQASIEFTVKEGKAPEIKAEKADKRGGHESGR